MTEHLDLAFNQHCSKNDCLVQESSDVFFIVDTIGKTILCKEFDTDDGCFKVENKNQRIVNFLCIDHCLLFDSDEMRCDCALFDDEVFRFIELKKSSTKTKPKRKAHALEQLKRTITLFYEKLPIQNHRLEAYMCIGFRRPIPRVTASSQFNVKDFIDNYHGTRLYEASLITI